MAYDANPLKEDSQQISPNVLSPQAQNQQSQTVEDEQPEMGAGSATITPGQGGSTPSQPSQKQSKDRPKSGMATNLRQYIQANRPQTQRISQAAAGNIGAQAESIGAQVQKQKQAQQQQIQQNINRRNEAQTFAQGLINQAGQSGNVDATDVQRFRQLATGKETFDDVDELDLTRQDIDAKRLQQTAQNAATARGQADILRDTFSRQGRQYTRGQSGLDRLLLAGDEQARQQIQQQAQTGAQQTAQDIANARRVALERLGNLQSENQAFAEQLQSDVTQDKQEITGQLESELQRRQAQRQQRIQQMQAEADRVRDYVQSIANLSDEEINNRIMRGFGVDENRIAIDGSGRDFDAVMKREFGDVFNPLALEALGYDPRDFGTFDAGYGTGRVNLWSGGGRKTIFFDDVRDLLQEIASKGRAFDSEAALQRAFSDTGVNLDQFRKGSDLNVANVATEDQRRRYDALRKLAGVSDQDANAILSGGTNLSANYDKIMDAIRRQRAVERMVM